MRTERTVWPNFFIAGAPKAGTTSLYFYLRQHPQIYMSPVKEPCFFAIDELVQAHFFDDVSRSLQRDGRSAASISIVTQEDQYQELFRGVRRETAIGEASVPYFYLRSASKAIAKRLPQARLLFVLRDPADRMFSQYLSSQESEKPQSFRERFMTAVDSQGTMSWWIESGKYATHLSRFLDHFPHAHIRAYLYEDYRRDPHAVLRDIFGFLGVDPKFRVDVSVRHNEPRVARFPLLHFLRRRKLGTELTRFVPKFLRSSIRSIYYHRRNDVQLTAEDRQLVIDFFRDEIERTARIIGRDLSAWLR